MILSLQCKQFDKLDLYASLYKNVDVAYGPQISEQVAQALSSLQKARDDLLNTDKNRNDITALDKLAEASKMYISIWSKVEQSFTFGTEPVLSI